MITIPDFPDLPAYCRNLRANGELPLTGAPWPDYIAPEDPDFRFMYPSNGGPEFYNFGHIESLRRKDQELLNNPKVTEAVKVSLRSELRSYRSWINQLRTGDVPECVGEGYMEWVEYLRENI